MTYHGRGEFEVSGKRTTYARVGMVAGGTGLTPMSHQLREPGDFAETRVRREH